MRRSAPSLVQVVNATQDRLPRPSAIATPRAPHRRARLALGLLVSAALAFALAASVDFAELGRRLASVSWPPLVLAVAVLLSTQVLKAWRWKHLLASVKQVRAADLLPATVIGAMADMIFPARIGELARAYVAARKEAISPAACVATIVVEKLFDVFVLLVLALGVVAPMLAATAQAPRREITLGVGVLFGGFVLATGAVMLLAARRERASRSLGRTLSFLPKRWSAKAVDWTRSFAAGCESLRSLGRCVLVFCISIALWGAFALGNGLILHAFDLGLPPHAPLVLLVFQMLGVTLPSSPGFVGAYHAAVVVGLSLFDVPRESALGVAVVMHAAFFIPFICWGLILAWREGLTLGALWAARQNATPSPSGA